MNPYLATGGVMLLSLIPCGVVCLRGDPVDRLVALETAGTIATLVLCALAEGMHRAPFFDLPLTLALLALAGGLVYARFLERWL